MGLRGDPVYQPRVPDQQADIAPGSPLAIVALFNEIIRERFRPGNGLPWVWSPNGTAGCDELNTPDSPRKIVIEPAFNEDPEVRNARPAIYVDKAETIAGKVVVNNFVGQQLTTGFQAFYTLATVPIEIECVGAKGESATIADLTWFYLLAGRQQIMATFGLHDLTPPVLGRTGPYEADKLVWSTKVTFECQINVRWTTLPISPKLAEIVLRFRKSGTTDPDTFLLEEYLHES